MHTRFIPILALLLVPPQISASDTVAQEDVDALYKIVMRLTNRISELEQQVEELKVQEIRSPDQPRVIAKAPIPVAASKAWHDPGNWRRLKKGMSEARVKQILGQPTRRRTNVIDYVTLTYSGFNSDGVSLTGNVELNQNDQIPYGGIKPPAW